MMYPYLEVEEHSICVTLMFHVAPVVDVLIVKANVLVDDDLPFSKYTKREQKYFFLNIQRYFSGSLVLVGIKFQDKSSVPNIKTFGLHIGSRESVRILVKSKNCAIYYLLCCPVNVPHSSGKAFVLDGEVIVNVSTQFPDVAPEVVKVVANLSKSNLI